MIRGRIYAMSMLVLFSTLILHSIIPHVHHNHDKNASVEHHHRDGNIHDHSHKERPTDQPDSENLIDVNLGHHTHSDFNSEYTTEIVSGFEKKPNNKKLAAITAKNTELKSDLSFSENIIPPQYRDFKPKNPFLLNCSLRAPPRLG